jgi:hypothetical protein
LICHESPELCHDYPEIRKKWDSLVVAGCATLTQRISIPEVQFMETIQHRWCLRKQSDGNIVILISQKGQKFTTIVLGEALEKYFRSKNVAPRIDKLLSTPDDNLDDLDELFGSIWKIPELPFPWRGLLSRCRAMGNSQNATVNSICNSNSS